MVTPVHLPTVLLLVVTPVSPARAAEYFPQPEAKGGWRATTDTSQIRKAAGIDAEKLDAAFQYIQQTSQHGGLLVVRHGWLVYERYFGRGNREALPELASCGKALTSIAVGIMLKEKASLIPSGLKRSLSRFPSQIIFS